MPKYNLAAMLDPFDLQGEVLGEHFERAQLVPEPNLVEQVYGCASIGQPTLHDLDRRDGCPRTSCALRR